MTQKNVWHEYYDQFDYFSHEVVRPDCHPRKLLHGSPSNKAIVLVHGLTDSPYFVNAIGEHFHQSLGYDVFMPLLHCHGLKSPNGMEGVSLDQWKANVRFATTVAAENAELVSIGGLSTGGALSFYEINNHKAVNGQLYLFSAALDLGGGWKGELKERFARTPLADLLDKFDTKALIGENPYRYTHIDMDGARELAKLIAETDNIQKVHTEKNPFPHKVFAAHSHKDTTADIAGVMTLESKCRASDFKSFYISVEKEVKHASLVLREDIPGSIEPLEVANPEFSEMMSVLSDFESVATAVVAIS